MKCETCIYYKTCTIKNIVRNGCEAYTKHYYTGA